MATTSFLVFGFSSCSKKESDADIYGVWARNEKTDYTFKTDGTGTLGHGDHSHEFTFVIEDDTITIRLSDSGNESKYNFVFEKDILSLSGIDETKGNFKLTRKK